jgi:hypothetical protein
MQVGIIGSWIGMGLCSGVSGFLLNPWDAGDWVGAYYVLFEPDHAACLNRWLPLVGSGPAQYEQ